MSDPLVRRARTATPEIIDFMRWSILPTATVSRKGCVARVRFGDARFANGSTASAFVRDVLIDTCRPAGTG